jgi:DNA-directed RNA polymerase subunit RPC12/RpoP
MVYTVLSGTALNAMSANTFSKEPVEPNPPDPPKGGAHNPLDKPAAQTGTAMKTHTKHQREVIRMVYRCNICGCRIAFLETDGDEVNQDFVCQECSEEIEEALRHEREVQFELKQHFNTTP